MIATWLAGKVSGLIIFVLACIAPIALVGWAWEGVALHGIAIPAPKGFPLYGPWELVHGALLDTKLANAARDKALHDLGVAQGNITRLRIGLGVCNASIDKLKKDGDQRAKDAQARVDAAEAEAKKLGARLAAVNAIKASNETCAVADTIINAGFGQ